MNNNKKYAFITEKLAGEIGGSEAIFFALIEAIPEASLFSPIVDKMFLPEQYKNLKINTTFLQKIPYAHKYYKALFPIMPMAIELLNLQEYDVVFSNHHCIAKGIIPRPDAIHISYCNSPARYIWDLFWVYTDCKIEPSIKHIMMGLLFNYIRMWDVSCANRVDHFLANSNFAAMRIKKYYNRESEILFPPVETDKFNHTKYENFYLMAGRLEKYKGVHLAVDAFNKSGKNLVIIGNGPEKEALIKKAKPNIKILGRVDNKSLIEHFNNCKGFIFPGKEDFGIVMVEAQSAGKPVIAYKAGGALDIVENNKTGILYESQTTSDLIQAIESAENINWDPSYISNYSKKFDVNIFKQKLKEILENPEQFKRNYKI